MHQQIVRCTYLEGNTLCPSQPSLPVPIFITGTYSAGNPADFSGLESIPWELNPACARHGPLLVTCSLHAAKMGWSVCGMCAHQRWGGLGFCTAYFMIVLGILNISLHGFDAYPIQQKEFNDLVV